MSAQRSLAKGFQDWPVIFGSPHLQGSAWGLTESRMLNDYAGYGRDFVTISSAIGWDVATRLIDQLTAKDMFSTMDILQGQELSGSIAWFYAGN